MGPAAAQTSSGEADNDSLLRTAVERVQNRDFITARALLSQVLRARPDDPTATFVLACVALEQGEWSEFDERIHSLSARMPQAPEIRMLATLGERRPGPPPGWGEFLAAWRRLGRPDFSKSTVLPQDIWAGLMMNGAGSELENDTACRNTTDARRILLLVEGQPTAEDRAWLIAGIPELQHPADVLALAGAFNNDSIPVSSRDEADKALRTRIDAWEQAGTLESSVGLLELSGTNPELPLSDAEVASLEVLAARPYSSEHLGDIYHRAYGVLSACRSSFRRLRAFQYAVSAIAPPAILQLKRRVKASAGKLSQPTEQRLGEALWTIGLKMSEETSLLERLLGLDLQKRAAEILGDKARQEQVKAVASETRRALRAAVPFAFDRWPLPSVAESAIEDQVQDEVRHFAELEDP